MTMVMGNRPRVVAGGRPSPLALLLFLSVCASLSSLVSSESCMAVQSADAGLFFNTPQEPSPPLSRCQPLNTKACCSATYTTQIDMGVDRVHQQIASQFANLPSECAALFDELACVYCSPDQGSFLATTPVGTVVLHVCESYCNRFYTTCGSALVKANNKTVAQTYATGKDFCAHDGAWYSVWWTQIISTASGDPCYDPDNGACTVNDIVGEYTECDSTYKTRNLIYHWKQRSDGTHCTPGAVQLPQNTFGLPCDIACGPGQYLPLGKTQCAPCAPGTYSVGGGVRFEDWGDANSAWPSKQQVSFTTYSQDSVTKQAKGNPWTKHGSYIESGNNTLWEDMESVLELTVTLVRDGNVTFEAKVDAETGYDGLRLEINNRKIYLNDVSHQFKRLTFNLTAGFNTIRWVYYKDYAYSVGEDRAFINMIEVEGLSYADDKCDVCPLGTFAPRNGSAECIPCTTPGYIPSGDPPTNCAACPLGLTALPFDSECRPMINCTTNDYERRYTDCRPPLPGSRNLTWEWTAPHICDDRYLALPPAQYNVPCQPCNAGEQRGANAACNYCPSGQYNTDGTACVACAQGVAVKSQIYRSFQFPSTRTGVIAWPSGWSTGCDHCDTNGFRPHYDYIDSGDGEGLFNSWLEIDADFYSAGQLELNVTLDCPLYDCSIRIWVDDMIEDMSFSIGNASYVFSYIVPIAETGLHKISIDFARWVPLYANHDHNNTVLKIHHLALVGVSPGGATSCSTCPPGKVASLDRTSCTKCPAGKVPSGGSCQSCPANSITLDAGASECITCGAGTTASGPSQCRDNNCMFNGFLNPSWPVSFNISMIATPTYMYGPLYAPGNTIAPYYFSMCTKATNNTCLNDDGTPMDAFACKRSWFGTYLNYGRLLNFVYDPPADPAEERLVVQYTHGSTCSLKKRDLQDADKSSSSARVARDNMLALYERDARASVTLRSTNITLICDPIAGIGSPQPHPDGITQGCSINFVWYSIYGCHICTENDYDYRYTPCVDGTRTKVYYWKYNPKRCWGGLSLLPQQIIETCSNTEIVCPDGQQISDKFDNCTACPAGKYSVSGGEVIQWWTYDSMTQYAFVASCTKASGDIDANCEDGWKPEGVNIASQGHMEGSAVLTTDRTFLHDGSIAFDLTLITENEEPLQFYIDNVLVKSWNHTTMQGSSSYKVNVRMGYHLFAWKFSPFVKQEKVRQAVIHSVTFRGLSYSKTSCTPCPAPLVALGPSATSCTPCPANTVYKNSAECEACPAGQYALPGDTVCRTRPACEASDFYQVFTSCVAAPGTTGTQRSSQWLPIQPQLCTGSVPGLQNKTVGCAGCPSGQHRETSLGPCVTCDAGYYYESNSAHCALAPPGTASLLMQEFFTGREGTAIVHIPASNKRALPDGWSTGCRGVCGTDGWRMLGDFMDSGLHYQQADSWVSYTTQLLADGEISFLVNASSHYDIGPSVASEFFIDNVPQPLHDLAAHTYKFQVSAGAHTFVWLHHQDQQSLRGDIRTVVSKIKILGASTGGYVAFECPPGYKGDGGQVPCTICPAGSYSMNFRSTKCTECPVGSFSSAPGSAQCTPCGAGTTANKEKGATECLSTCRFSVNVTDTATSLVGNYTFDLTELHQLGPLTVTSGHKAFTLRVCEKLTAAQSPCKSSSAFVCEDDADLHESFEAGNLLSFVPNQPEPDSHNVAAGFTLEYSMGSLAGCPKTRKTSVRFNCQMGATPYVAQYTEATRQCEYSINVNTQYACPICNEFDLLKVTGTCETTGERVIKYEPLVPCIGVPAPQREKCSDVEVNEWAIVITTGIVVVLTVSLVTAAIYFWRKKALSEQKYALLVQETTAPVEMQDFDDGDDEPSFNKA